MRGLQNTRMNTHVKEYTRQPKVVHINSEHAACGAILCAVWGQERDGLADLRHQDTGPDPDGHAERAW